MSREEQAKQEDKKLISDFNEWFTKKYGDSKNWTHEISENLRCRLYGLLGRTFRIKYILNRV